MPLRVDNSLKDYSTRLVKWIKYQKAIALDNSELFDVHTWSEYPEVTGAVNQLYSELLELADFSGHAALRKKHLKVLILHLYVTWFKDTTRYTSLNRRKAYYDNLVSRYNKLFIRKVTILIVDALHELGYIELHLGTYGRESGYKSRLTRIRAKEKLTSLFVENHFSPEMIERAPNIETLILRDYASPDSDDVIEVGYLDESDPRIISWRNNLVAYNNLLRRTYIDVPSALDGRIPCRQSARAIRLRQKPKVISINQHDKFVRRVFNYGDWNLGGRFYGGWWQRISEDWRSRIRIWNNPVTEVDYKGLHINLLYRKMGIVYDEDPYLLDGYEHTGEMRQLLKLVLLCSINAENKTKAIQAINKDVNFNPDDYGWVREEEVDIGLLVDALTAKHPLIAEQFFFKNQGIELQNLDSMIAERIVNHFTGQNIPVLCVHDSFVIQANMAEELNAVMAQSFLEAFSELGLDQTTPPGTDLTGMDYGQFATILSHPDWRETSDALYREQYEYPEWTRKLRKFREMTQATEFNSNYYQADNNFLG